MCVYIYIYIFFTVDNLANEQHNSSNEISVGFSLANENAPGQALGVGGNQGCLTANLPTNIVGLRGFNSSTILL